MTTGIMLKIMLAQFLKALYSHSMRFHIGLLSRAFSNRRVFDDLRGQKA